MKHLREWTKAGRAVTQEGTYWETEHIGNRWRRRKLIWKYWLANNMCEFYRKGKVEDVNNEIPEKKSCLILLEWKKNSHGEVSGHESKAVHNICRRNKDQEAQHWRQRMFMLAKEFPNGICIVTPLHIHIHATSSIHVFILKHSQHWPTRALLSQSKNVGYWPRPSWQWVW